MTSTSSSTLTSWWGHCKLGMFVTGGITLAGTFLVSSILDTQWYLGSLVMAYFTTQVAMAMLNHRVVNRLTNRCQYTNEEWNQHNVLLVYKEQQEWFHAHREKIRTAILVVGYREDPDYWRACLESIRDHGIGEATGNSVTGVFACVDGDSANDHFMSDIFHEVFRNHTEEEEGGMKTVDLHPHHDHIMIKEFPHRGKRHTLRSGIEWIRTFTYEYILVMDSDSVLTPNAVWSLVRIMSENENNGCATGTLKIYNRNNYITRVIHARYGYAFNIERSAMSYAGCMNCCSGPFSIYRNAFVDEQFLEDLTTQTCFGENVGPGDDRHLTNLMMIKGHFSIQSPLSIVYTECPSTMPRFLIQQLRWMRSFYREQYYQIKAIPSQSWWLMVVTIYELLFPYVVILGFLPAFGFLHWTPMSVLLHRLYICLTVIGIRTFVLMMMSEWQWVMLYNLLMFPMYFCILLPMKIYAGMTVGLQSWMTSDRLLLKKKWNVDVWLMYTMIVLWNVFYITLGLHRFRII